MVKFYIFLHPWTVPSILGPPPNTTPNSIPLSSSLSLHPAVSYCPSSPIFLDNFTHSTASSHLVPPSPSLTPSSSSLPNLSSSCSHFLRIPQVYMQNKQFPVNRVSIVLHKRTTRNPRLPSTVLHILCVSKGVQIFLTLLKVKNEPRKCRKGQKGKSKQSNKWNEINKCIAKFDFFVCTLQLEKGKEKGRVNWFLRLEKRKRFGWARPFTSGFISQWLFWAQNWKIKLGLSWVIHCLNKSTWDLE